MGRRKKEIPTPSEETEVLTEPTEKDSLEKTLTNLKNESDVNPDLKEFFDEVQKRKEDFKEEKVEEKKEEVKEEVQPVKKKKGSFFKNSIVIVAFILSILYYLVYIKTAFDTIDYVKNIINASLLLLTLFVIVIALLSNRVVKTVFTVLSALLIIGLVTFNTLVMYEKIKLPLNEVLENLVNTSITSAMKYASEKNIKLSSIYEYSDNIDEGYIISQDIKEGTLLKKVKELKLIVSNGPSFDKENIIAEWAGRTLDELLKYIEDNHLNNVTLDFKTSDEYEKDTIISQSIKGEIKRNDAITFTISLGNADSLKEITLEDLTNKTEFNATLYLKRNAIKYQISYEFSSTIKKGNVISHTPSKGTTVKPNSDTVNLVISKGKEIIVPDFSGKEQDEVVSWVVDNNLKISFNEKYSTTIKEGKVIELNYKVGSSISEGTKVVVTTSRGSLKVINTKSVAEFRTWASTNGVTYSENYEFNNSVSKGTIIKTSIAAGSPIDPAVQSIVVTVSNGTPVSVPNFVGKSKSSIQSECGRVGLNCTFYYVGYNSAAKDTATTQNIGSGRQVVSGTYVSIGLSSGPAQTFDIYIQTEWFASSASATIASLKSILSTKAPGVNFNYVTKPHNSLGAGMIHEDSPIKAGVTYYVTQGKTYTIWIVE